MIGLRGSLESIYLASILQLLCNDKKSGMLRVWSTSDEVRIFFDRGTIVYSTGSQKSTRLGFLLRSERLIPEEQLWYCLGLARERKTALGKILVEQGLISQEKLEQLNSWKVEQTLYNLFLWKKGEFEFLDRELNLEGHILTQIDTMEIILEASRRADEMSVLIERLPGDGAVIAKTGKPAGEQMDAETADIFALVDGASTIKHIAAKSRYDSFTVYKSMDSLLAAGMVTACVQAPPLRSNDSVYFTTIVQVYYDALSLVCEAIEQNSQSTAFELYTQSLQALQPREQLLLAPFSIMLSVAKNMQELERAMASFSDREEGSLCLINAFDDLLLNLLNSHKTAAGEDENRSLIGKIENMLSVLHRYRKDSSFGIEIISSEGTPDIT